jgi:hypothetical protein
MENISLLAKTNIVLHRGYQACKWARTVASPDMVGNVATQAHTLPANIAKVRSTMALHLETTMTDTTTGRALEAREEKEKENGNGNVQGRGRGIGRGREEENITVGTRPRKL